jgi:hypothetical protein
MSVFGNILNNEVVKVYTVSAIGWVSAMTTIDVALKVVLLVVSIVYTVVKTVAIIKNEINKIKKND